MSENTVLSFLCLLPWCLGALAFLGGGVLLTRLLLRGQRAKSENEWQAAQGNMAAEVAALLPQVQPWRAEALADLYTFRHLRWSVFGRHARARGLIAASKSDQQSIWAAFSLRGRRVYRRPVTFEGKAHARTTAQTFDFESDASNQVAIRVDSRPLGSLQADGRLLDPSGEPIGQIANAEKGTPTRPVTLHGRVVAHMGAYSGGVFSFRGVPRSPAVEIVAPDVTPEERDWLLALALWRIINRAGGQISNDGI